MSVSEMDYGMKVIQFFFECVVGLPSVSNKGDKVTCKLKAKRRCGLFSLSLKL